MMILQHIRISLIMIAYLLIYCNGYLQFTLTRVQGRQDPNNNTLACIDQKTDNQFTQLCYDKDISYVIQLEFNKDLYNLAVDLTTPISWLKGNKCTLTSSKKKCQLINTNFRDQVLNIQYQIESVGTSIKNRFKKHNVVDNNGGEFATIEGSTEIVKGYVEKVQKMQFTMVDSGRLTRFLDLIMLGFYIVGEQDKLTLNNTNFINATEISSNLNDLQDGAISLRFDQSSEKSFLQQIFYYVRNISGQDEQFITIFLGSDIGRNNTITIGQISVKNSQEGYSSIHWIKTQEYQKYGKAPSIHQIVVGNKEDQDKVQFLQIPQLSIIFTLSASYIAFPESVLEQIFKKLSKFATCSLLPQQLFVECEVKSKIFHNQQIIIDMDTGMVSFTLDQLILDKGKNKKVILNIRKSYNENYAILGEPVFKKYFILFNFKKNAIGISPRRKQFNSQIINVVTLIRFVTFTFFLGCSFLVCFYPVKRCINILARVDYSKKGPQGQKLRSYSPIQQNPYDDIKGKIQQVLNNNKDNELEGI